MIEFINVTKSFGEHVVFDHLSLSLPDTGCFVIMGPSGCGKTTLVRLLAGLDHPDSGTVSHAFSNISMVFQEPRLLEWMTAEENVKVVLSKVYDEKKLAHVLEAFGIHEFAAKYPRELSGGMKKRVAIARALAFDGDLLILDEAFGGLDEETAFRFIDTIKDMRGDRPTLLITHNKTEAERFGPIFSL